MRGTLRLVGGADPITIASGLLGGLAIVLTLLAVDAGDLAGPAGRTLWGAVLVVVASTALDAIDGPLARHRAKRRILGKHLDLMSDWLSFTVAPGLITWVALDGMWQAWWWRLALLLAAAWVAACGALRLARFAVQDGGDGRHFHGLASPGAALGMLAVISLHWTLGPAGMLAAEVSAIGAPLLMLVIGALMISDRPLPKLSDRRVRPWAIVSSGTLALAALVGTLGLIEDANGAGMVAGALSVGVIAGCVYLLRGPAWLAAEHVEREGVERRQVEGSPFA